MSALLHKIVFTGETLDGLYIQDVRLAAERRLGMSPNELDLVFSGRRVVLKRGLSGSEAERYIRELAKLGMHVVSKPQPVLAQKADTSSVDSLKAQLQAQSSQTFLPKRGGFFGLFSR